MNDALDTQPFNEAELAKYLRKCLVDNGDRVRLRRTALDMSRNDLCARVDVTIPTLHRIETGQLDPRDSIKVRIAEALECEIGDLWPTPLLRDVFDALAKAEVAA